MSPDVGGSESVLFSTDGTTWPSCGMKDTLRAAWSGTSGVALGDDRIITASRTHPLRRGSPGPTTLWIGTPKGG